MALKNKKITATLSTGVALLMLCVAFSPLAVCSDDESMTLEFSLPECNAQGGFLLLNRCMCKFGYTGSLCDVSLFLEEENSRKWESKTSDDLETIIDGQDTRSQQHIIFEITGNEQALDVERVRIKRQMEQGEGSAEPEAENVTESTTESAADGTAVEAGTTQPTTAAVDATAQAAATTEPAAASTVTPAASNATEVPPATESTNATTTAPNTTTATNTTAATNTTTTATTTTTTTTTAPPASALQVRMTISNENFVSDLSNMSSSASQNLIASITNETKTLMKGTSYNRIEIMSFEAGSVVVNAVVFFDSSNKSLIELSDLLQTRMRTSNVLTFSSITAVDYDECMDATTNNCDSENSTCVNTPGSFLCMCKPGYSNGNSLTAPCREICEAKICENGGTCIAINNTAACSCPDMFSGDSCEVSVFPLQQATIAVSVVLGVLVFIALAIILFLLCRTCRKKEKKTNEVPMGTGFRSTMQEEYEKSYDNPQDASQDEQPTPVNVEPAHDDAFRSSTSTFRPDNGASAAAGAADQDDKL